MTFHPRFARLAHYATCDEAAINRSRTAAHLASCPRCRAAVTWVRDARAALRDTDGPSAPAGTWERIQTRLEEGDVVLLPTGDVRVRDARRRDVRGRRIAIAASLVLATGVAAAVAPSTMRHWLERSIASIAAIVTHERTSQAPNDVTATDAVPRTVLIVPAADGGVIVDIDGAEPGLEVRIRTTEAPELEVEAFGSAAAARFQSGTGRLSITETGTGEILLSLPRTLERATIGVDGTPYVIKRGDELRVLASFADTIGSEIVLRPTRAPSETRRSR